MKRLCRVRCPMPLRKRSLTWREAFPHATIVTDVTKLAQLNAEVAKRKQKEHSQYN